MLSALCTKEIPSERTKIISEINTADANAYEIQPNYSTEEPVSMNAHFQRPFLQKKLEELSYNGASSKSIKNISVAFHNQKLHPISAKERVEHLKQQNVDQQEDCW